MTNPARTVLREDARFDHSSDAEQQRAADSHTDSHSRPTPAAVVDLGAHEWGCREPQIGWSTTEDVIEHTRHPS
jgi:hypothetical protein